ncbi:MAG TPA: metallophosphoesterase [Polyangiaceae bacterium]|nr:metallophosphoesterase [Polyangiaceae bacterium]
MKRSRALLSILWISVCAGCGDDERLTEVAPLPPLSEAPLTTERTLVPVHAFEEADLDKNVQVPEAMNAFLEQGYGETKFGPGEPVLKLTLDGAKPPADGKTPKLLTRFVHLADIQLADDESPARFAALDFPLFSSPYRPQEGHECHILNAAVRTINRVHEDTPVEFVILGGDNVDSAQQNEHEWLLKLLSGAARVECDSGNNDDPVPGPGNDPKDALSPEGLAMPWLWVTGNHDVLVQGITPIAELSDRAVGDEAPFGARDWSKPGGPITRDVVVPDKQRLPLTVKQILEGIASDGDGHGIDDSVIARDKANFVYDLPNAPIRMLVIDSATALGGAEGVITQTDVSNFIRPAIEQAKLDKKWVILASHHSSNTLADGTLGGKVQPGALSEDEWRSFLGSYDNVLAHLTGHSHIHRVHVRQGTGAAPYFELITAALADYPNQMRLIEVWDTDNGYVMLRAINLDYSTEGDPIAEDGRKRSVVDLTSGWIEDASGAADDRNVELYVKSAF